MSEHIKVSTTFAGGVHIDRAFAVINQMVVDGVIESYAVGGATAAFFYIEPDTTYDVDIFVLLQTVHDSGLIMLTPIYDYLSEKGYKPDKEMVIIEGVLVQFLPVYNPLIEEAVERANTLDYEGVPVRVTTPEHLVTIMLQTGRVKDLVRIARFYEAGAFNQDLLMDILTRYKLKEKLKALGAVQRRLSK